MKKMTGISEDRGFSLVELMVVLSILVLLSVLAAPAFLEYVPKYRVDGAAKALASEMSLARMKAISGNTRTRASFDVTNKTVTIESVDAGGNAISTLSKIILTAKPSGVVISGYPVTYIEAISIGRNTTKALTDSPNGSTTAAVAFGAGSATSITFLPSGIATMSGEFFLTPDVDIGASSVTSMERTRAVQISAAGMVRKFRYDRNPDPTKANQVSQMVWTEY